MKPNTPSQSQKSLTESPHSGLPRQYLREEEMVNPVRTDISVGDMNLFRTFLEANDMGSFELGYYSVPLDYHFSKGHQENKICYSNNNPPEIVEDNLIHMTLKYGGLVEAFKDFKKAIGRI